MNDLIFIFLGDKNLEHISLKNKTVIIQEKEYTPEMGAEYLRAIDEAFLNRTPIRVKKD